MQIPEKTRQVLIIIVVISLVIPLIIGLINFKKDEKKEVLEHEFIEFTQEGQDRKGEIILDIDVVTIERTTILKSIPTPKEKPPIETELILTTAPTEVVTTTPAATITTTSTAATTASTTTVITTSTDTVLTTSTAANDYVFNLTPAERRDVAALLYLEAGSTSYQCQKLVAEVIFNQWRSRGGSIYDTLYAPNLFTPAYSISYTTPMQTQFDIVDTICSYGVSIPWNVLYFRAGYYHSFGTPYTNIGNVYFSSK